MSTHLYAYPNPERRYQSQGFKPPFSSPSPFPPLSLPLPSIQELCKSMSLPVLSHLHFHPWIRLAYISSAGSVRRESAAVEINLRHERRTQLAVEGMTLITQKSKWPVGLPEIH